MTYDILKQMAFYMDDEGYGIEEGLQNKNTVYSRYRKCFYLIGELEICSCQGSAYYLIKQKEFITFLSGSIIELKYIKVNNGLFKICEWRNYAVGKTA